MSQVLSQVPSHVEIPLTLHSFCSPCCRAFDAPTRSLAAILRSRLHLCDITRVRTDKKDRSVPFIRQVSLYCGILVPGLTRALWSSPPARPRLYKNTGPAVFAQPAPQLSIRTLTELYTIARYQPDFAVTSPQSLVSAVHTGFRWFILK
jgi:hypothetical protein